MAGNSNYKFLQRGGEMGELVRSIDWSKNILGTPDTWPQSLRTTLSILLNSRFPMFLFWGPELICFYNDAYRPSLGNNGKHPSAMGNKGAIVWPEIWNDIKPLIDQILAGGEASWSEDQLLPIYRNQRMEDVYWTFSYSPVNDESGKPAGVFVTCTETTEKVSILRSVNENSKELEFAIEANKLGTWYLDPLTNHFTANARLKNWFGLHADEEIDLSDALNMIVEKDRERVIAAIQKALTDPDYNYNEIYTIQASPQKPERMVSAKGQAFFNNSGIVYKFRGTLQDVTEETIARKAIEYSEERARLAVEAADMGTYDLNLLTNEFVASPRLDAIFGISNSSSHKTYVSCIHTDDLIIRNEAFKEALQTGTLSYIVRVIWDDGNEHWVRAAGKVIYDNDRKPVRMLGIIMDITEQKQFMQQKDNFIGIASHELKTPVTSIKAYTQVLQKMLEKKGDLREAGMIKKMDTQINRLTSLIGDLLDVTKINSGKIQFNDSEFDFNSLLSDSVEDLQRTTEKHTLIMDFKFAGNVYADKERVGQVISNLITNAIKYSPQPGKIIIHSELKDNEIIVCVEDFGIGIPGDKLNKVFEQFYRVSGSVQHTFPGLGLGLYISSEIIKREGGRIWVNSEEGKGSSFCFSLPVKM